MFDEYGQCKDHELNDVANTIEDAVTMYLDKKLADGVNVVEVRALAEILNGATQAATGIVMLKYMLAKRENEATREDQ